LLFVLIPAVFVAFALLGLSMCRLAALSDNKHAAALAEWLAMSHPTEHRAAPADSPREQFQFDPRDDAFRATG
jgi:hypothetical protein